MGFNSGFKGLKLSAMEKIWTRRVGATDRGGLFIERTLIIQIFEQLLAVSYLASPFAKKLVVF